MKAYYNISFEREAYADKTGNVKCYSWVKYLKNSGCVFS